MTGYYISIGYNSGNPKTPEGNLWHSVKRIANSITLEELKAEYLEYEDIVECEDGCCKIDEFVAKYSARDDLTIGMDDQDEEIWQHASGGGYSRLMKEGLRRAFCRLMLKKAHREKIEISIHVS